MRVRQIFLVVSVVTMVCGCSGGNADGQMRRELMEKAEEYQQEKIYIKGPEGTPFAFLVERGNGTGEVVRKDIGGCGESQIKQEIDKKMLDAVLRGNGEKKRKITKKLKKSKKVVDR